jgi:hypothetical protein
LLAQIAQRKAARDAQVAELDAGIAFAELELENLLLEEDMRSASRASRLRLRGQDASHASAAAADSAAEGDGTGGDA